MRLNRKPTLLLITIFLTVLSYAHAQKQPTDLSEMNLSGQVQTISIIEYSINKDDIFVQEASFLTNFNTKGYSLQEDHYNRDLRLDFKTFFEYDDKERLIKSKKYTIYKSLDSNLVSENILTYDAEGKKTVLDHYDAKGVLKAKTTWKEGLVQIVRYAPDGTAMITSVQKFNKKGKQTSEEKYITNKVLKSSTKWKHSKRKIIINRYNEEGKLTYKSIQKLDAHGNLVSWNFPALKKQNTYEYKYDKQNNWTQKITYKNGKVRSKVERSIIYY